MPSSSSKDSERNKSFKGRESACVPILDSVKSPREKLTILERAIASARNGIVITDPTLDDNPIVYVNQSFLTLTGYGADEVVGRNCRFLQGEDRRQKALDDLRNAIKETRAITCVLKNYRKDGSVFWNELTVSPVHNEKGKLINFIGIQNDISSRVEAETRISEFYSIVSHELRTPLTSIRSSLGLLEEGEGGSLSPEGKKLVEIAFRNTDRLVRLVNDILDFRKIESEKLELRYSSITARSIVEQVVRELSPTASEKSIGLVVDIKSGSEAAFKADRDRIIQVLTNLTANAIKFSGERSDVTIVVDLRRKNFLRFSVSDQGPGIPRSEVGKLFQKFQQIDSSDRRREGGTGLGLAISKSLVEMHGGNIGVDTTLGSGSTFWFEVPITRI
ncbi:PAS domain-containing protein [bacterium]|nr:PAS domain-containing protein [bacterium]